MTRSRCCLLRLNMGDYFAHWLDIGRSADAAKLPRIYFVNWFRKDQSGRSLWPGFGENSRVLKWIIERLSGDAPAAASPIGKTGAGCTRYRWTRHR